MDIKVTQLHIDEGTEGSFNSCPLALALHESGFSGASVCPCHGMQFDGCFTQLPEAALEFMTAFDADMPVSPFEFTLEV